MLCEGIGSRALEQAISFLYSGTVDISEGSLVCLGIGLCMEVCVTIGMYSVGILYSGLVCVTIDVYNVAV